MVALLGRLRDLVKATREGALVLIWMKGEGMKVFEATSDRKVLPDDVVERFWSKKKADA
jgi:hypothetical protein